MDTTYDPTDIAIIDDACPEIEDISFTKEIAKTLALSAATTAGMVGGLVVIGLAVNKVNDLRTKRQEKKAAEKATQVDVTDKTPANQKD